MFASMIASLIISALLTIGAVVAVVLIIKALRRIARNQERSVALLEEVLHHQRSGHLDSESKDGGPTGSSPA